MALLRAKSEFIHDGKPLRKVPKSWTRILAPSSLALGRAAICVNLKLPQKPSPSWSGSCAGARRANKWGTPVGSELIFVTNITNYICGEKIVLWRKDLRAFMWRKIEPKKYICGEKMANMRNTGRAPLRSAGLVSRNWPVERTWMKSHNFAWWQPTHIIRSRQIVKWLQW